MGRLYLKNPNLLSRSTPIRCSDVDAGLRWKSEADSVASRGCTAPRVYHEHGPGPACLTRQDLVRGKLARELASEAKPLEPAVLCGRKHSDSTALRAEDLAMTFARSRRRKPPHPGIDVGQFLSSIGSSSSGPSNSPIDLASPHLSFTTNWQSEPRFPLRHSFSRPQPTSY